ncbi:CbiX/SirB N-terminal domain-containing protein [Actinomadura syzygii]|uniref:Cobalamin biosynthesis protein CbiX n=1 Tax=Actinomadura syzygii TaxID=1427538 RepID=A0A5D0U1Q9_9ACTN|nr:CbiX/SirB N-terminal domain-containing protein [Actinomadura syzygii]TYC12521.1 cobalamin biosynthesis protein CbiX [Actinomadura syzygii]
MTGDRAVLAVGGHESLAAGTAGIHDPGRGLRTALGEHARAVVVPMTLGRDPGVAQAAAQTLAWAARERRPGDLLLAPPLGTAAHLVGWIRAAVVRTIPGAGFHGAVLLVAPAADPEADAELFKVARLVRQYLPVRWVEVALADGEPDVAEGVERCRRLGAGEVVLVPASLVPLRPDSSTGADRVAGPLLGGAALAALVRERAAEAERRWRRNHDDGLAAAANQGHGHGHGHEHEHEHGGAHEARHHDDFSEVIGMKPGEGAAHGRLHVRGG